MALAPSPLRSLIPVWLVLVLATLLGGRLAGAAQYGAVKGRVMIGAILAIACAKVWLVGWRFMELSTAPRWLRLGFSAWACAVGALLFVIVQPVAQ